MAVEHIPSKTSCDHFRDLRPGERGATYTGFATVGPANCPWCEIARLRAALDAWDRWYCTVPDTARARLPAETAAVRETSAQDDPISLALTDAARYRWLRSYGISIWGTENFRRQLVSRCSALDKEVDQLRAAERAAVKATVGVVDDAPYNAQNG